MFSSTELIMSTSLHFTQKRPCVFLSTSTSTTQHESSFLRTHAQQSMWTSKLKNPNYTNPSTRQPTQKSLIFQAREFTESTSRTHIFSEKNPSHRIWKSPRNQLGSPESKIKEQNLQKGAWNLRRGGFGKVSKHADQSMSGRIIKCACFYLKRNRPFDEAVIIPIPIFASPPLTPVFSLFLIEQTKASSLSLSCFASLWKVCACSYPAHTLSEYGDSVAALNCEKIFKKPKRKYKRIRKSREDYENTKQYYWMIREWERN